MRTILFNALVAKLFPQQVNAVFDQGFNYGVAVSTYRRHGDAMKTKGCSALQMSDQMVCNKCGLRWDMNDPDPPTCRTLSANAVIEVGSSDKTKNRFYHAFKNNLMLMKQQQEKRK